MSSSARATTISDPQWTTTSVSAFAYSDKINSTTVVGPSVYHAYNSGYMASNTANTQNADSSLSLADSITSPIIPEGYNIPVTWATDGQSAASGAAGPGALHAYAYAQATFSPESVTNTQTDSAGNTFSNTGLNPLEANASASASVAVKDTITFSSSSLGPNDLVHFTLTLVLDGTTTTSGPNGGVYSNSYAALAAETYYRLDYYRYDQFGYADGGHHFTSSPLDLNSAGVISIDVACPLDATLSLFASLSADASARSGNSSNPPRVPLATGLADAADTGSVYIDPLDSSFSIVTTSGYSYATPTPEPATLPLLAAAGLFLLSTRRSRQPNWQESAHWASNRF